ncbi:hypothetical protein CPB85DRAFT_1305586 [Mucidula mucida]|nr:hypothetical protein CPB85DRAFT_1305586 [Mucidula mucida]
MPVSLVAILVIFVTCYRLGKARNRCCDLSSNHCGMFLSVLQHDLSTAVRFLCRARFLTSTFFSCPLSICFRPKCTSWLSVFLVVDFFLSICYRTLSEAPR